MTESLTGNWKVLRDISMALIGIARDDLTTAEREIVKILIAAEIVKYADDGEVIFAN